MKTHLCDSCYCSYIESDSMDGIVIYRTQICGKFEMDVTPYVEGDEMEECNGYEGKVSHEQS